MYLESQLFILQMDGWLESCPQGKLTVGTGRTYWGWLRELIILIIDPKDHIKSILLTVQIVSMELLTKTDLNLNTEIREMVY